MKILRMIYGIVILVLLSACGLTIKQSVKIGKFNDATIVLSDIASNEFAQSRADLIEIN